MKLTVMLILALTVGANASGLAQKVTLSLKDASLEELIAEIRKQTDYEFMYNDELLKKDLRLTLEIKNGSIKEVLRRSFEGQPLTYRIIAGTVILMPEISGSGSSFEMPQRLVTGTVRDTTGAPLSGVSVTTKHGPSTGVATDPDGRYSLEVSEDAVLVFSLLGFMQLEAPVSGKTVVDVVMKVEETMLDELVVVGYGTQKKANLTGAVDVISSELLESRQSPTVSQLLQGQSPGLSFSIGDNGFQPGAEMGIDIRGTGSLNGGGPYVLIDGIPGDMNRINPEDIASISVLKDAAASAIYGARAPYGVILITTKSGRKNEKISVTYSGSVSQATPQRLPEMLDSYTHARAINEAGLAGRGGRSYSNETVDRIIAYQEGDLDYLKQFTVPDADYFETVPLANGFWGQMQHTNANYDWFDEYYGSGMNQKHNLSLQGGGKSTSYYFSAGYFGQEGVLNYGTDTYERLNVSGKVEADIADWWKFTYQPRFMKSMRVLPNPQNNYEYGVIFHQIARTMPMQAKYDGYGNYTIHSKIPWTQYSGTNQIETTENWQTFATELRPLANWKINADFAYQATDFFESDQAITVYETLVDHTTVPNGNTVPSSIRQFHRSDNYWTSNIYSTYSLRLKDQHNFTLLAGMQLESNKLRRLNARKDNLLVQDVLSLQTASGDPVVTENLAHWSTQGYFSRLTYNFREKYLFELNVRRDGTSRFREGKRWGTFPSVSAGWNVHREAFWKGIENTVNTFKLRGSWGSLGNQNVTPYQDLNLIPLQTGQLSWIFGHGQSPLIGFTGTPGLISPDLTWETATTSNAGIDLSFLNNRLQTSFDWFQRVTTDMIGPTEAQPGVLGQQLPQANNSTLRSRGWELSLRWEHHAGANLSYYVNANLYNSRSVVTKYLNPTGTLATWYNGKEEGEIWGYAVHDLYRSQEEVESHSVDLSAIWGGDWRPGDVKYEDVNGDGAVNNGSNTIYDPGDRSIIGNSTPHYQYGISAGIHFKGFDFSMLWKGTAKRDLFFENGENIFWGFKTWNQSSLFPWHLDYFRDQEGDRYTGLYEGADNFNTDAYWPRPYLHGGENGKNRQASTRYLQNAAYLRLQNVQLGYNFKDTFLSKWNISNLRLYLSGENVFTLTKLPDGIDPIALSSEMGVGKTYGADRILSFGMIITY